MEKELLLKEIKNLIGRDANVIRTGCGLFIVEWFNFNLPPPPQCQTEEEALRAFIEFVKQHKLNNGENIDGIETTDP